MLHHHRFISNGLCQPSRSKYCRTEIAKGMIEVEVITEPLSSTPESDEMRAEFRVLVSQCILKFLQYTIDDHEYTIHKCEAGVCERGPDGFRGDSVNGKHIH